MTIVYCLLEMNTPENIGRVASLKANYLANIGKRPNKIGLIVLLFIVAQSVVFGYTTSDISEYISFYISSSQGNDNNDGKSADKPFKTIRKAIQETGKSKLCIRLKCGDMFFENMTGLSDCIIESYGKGSKPVLCGFKILKNPDAWQADSIKGVWRLDLSNDADLQAIR